MAKQAKMPTTVLWQPHPENIPQQQAFESLADETFHGGSAGGGKTDLGLGIGIVQGKRTVMFRRHFTDLKWLEERSKQIIGSTGTLNRSDHTWRHSGDRILQLAGLQYEKDWEKWQGTPFDTHIWDEVTQFSKNVYQTLSAWNRSEDPNQRCRIVATFNPPTTAEGIWVIEHLAPWLDPKHPNPAVPGELRWFAMIDGQSVEVESSEPFEHNGETIHPRSRTFIRAGLADNPYYSHNAQYLAALQALPEPLRSQMLYGDMSIGMQDDEWQLIPSHWILMAQERWKAGRPKNEDGTNRPLSAIGADVARGGADSSVLACCYDWWIDKLKVKPGRETPTGEDFIHWLEKSYETLDDLGQVPIAIDSIGVGASPYDYGRRNGHRIYGINAASATSVKASKANFGFINTRAYMYWLVREALDPEGHIHLALPPDPMLTAELLAHQYEVTPRGIKIIAKDKIKEKIGRSPDRAEAVALAMKVLGRRNV